MSSTKKPSTPSLSDRFADSQDHSHMQASESEKQLSSDKGGLSHTYRMISSPPKHDPPTVLDDAWGESNVIDEKDTDHDLNKKEELPYITPTSTELNKSSLETSDDLLAHFLTGKEDLIFDHLFEEQAQMSQNETGYSKTDQTKLSQSTPAHTSLFLDVSNNDDHITKPIARFDDKKIPNQFQQISPELSLSDDQNFETPIHQHIVQASNSHPPIKKTTTQAKTYLPNSKTRYIVFAGGKGGVGRSLLAANLSIYLSRLGRQKVIVADLDPNGSNLHTYLGIDPVISTPGDYLRSQPTAYLQAIEQSDVHLCRIHHPIHQHLNVSIRQTALDFIKEQTCDYVILDVGSTPDQLNLDLFLQADLGIVVFTPSNVSIERGYNFLQTALYHDLLGGNHDAAVVSRALLNADQVGQLHSPDSLIQALQNVNPQAALHIQNHLSEFSPKIIMNQCHTRTERNLCKEICQALWKKWHINPVALASIDHDELVNQSILKRKPMVFDCPGASSSIDLEKLARSILSQEFVG